jgi:hypothetical protein
MSRTTPPAETVLVLVWHDGTENRLGILPDDHVDFIEDVLLDAGIPVYRESGDDYLWTQTNMSTPVQIALRLARQEVVYLDKSVYPYSVAIKSKRSGTIRHPITVHAHTATQARKMALLAFHHRQNKNADSRHEGANFALSDYTAVNAVKGTDSTGPFSTAR